MTIKKNKLLSLITLLILVMMPAFISSYYLVQQIMIRHEMKEQLEVKSLQTFRIADQNISWVKKGKELIIEGKFFDVKYFKIIGDSAEVTGLFDEMESSLQHQLIFLHNPEKNGKQKQEFIYRILMQQQAEKTQLLPWEISFINTEFIFNPCLPDIMLRDPHLLFLPKPPDQIV